MGLSKKIKNCDYRIISRNKKLNFYNQEPTAPKSQISRTFQTLLAAEDEDFSQSEATFSWWFRETATSSATIKQTESSSLKILKTLHATIRIKFGCIAMVIATLNVVFLSR
ncbi:hypothetical protein OIU77_026484 [Salix suchowensis]|uniref:Uncharacterized protein n=1 Tax=Salix suchowensis TaxID=1278906 RepID=A0ABQ9BNS4_9ROSI|nr:hypothetical protein OIU77_026484 [Salix suchowensis]